MTSLLYPKTVEETLDAARTREAMKELDGSRAVDVVVTVEFVVDLCHRILRLEAALAEAGQ